LEHQSSVEQQVQQEHLAQQDQLVRPALTEQLELQVQLVQPQQLPAQQVQLVQLAQQELSDSQLLFKVRIKTTLRLSQVQVQPQEQ